MKRSNILKDRISLCRVSKDTTRHDPAGSHEKRSNSNIR